MGRKKTKDIQPKDRLLPKITLWFFNRGRFTALLFLVIFLFGILSYTTLLKREGFPSVNFPIASIAGVYAVDNPDTVDQEVAKPITDAVLDQDGVSTVMSNSYGSFFNVIVQYDEDVNAQAAISDLKERLEGKLPEVAQVEYTVPYFSPAGATDRKLDVAVSFYDYDNVSTEQLTADAEVFADKLRAENLPLVEEIFVIHQFEDAVHPLTGENVNVQRSFDRFGVRENGENKFYNSVTIGVAGVKNVDVIKLDQQMREAVAKLADDSDGKYGAKVSASYAPAITESINELQRVLLEALIAILIVGSIVIAIRASVITVVSLLSVLAATLGLLFLIGYSLNVITLFAVILSLALIVDDTIIMIEAIDAQRKRRKDARKAVEVATRKVSRAMIAATLTAALSFTPLIFVGGILGSFIRAIPVTIISALGISLLFALIIIPFLARFILLGKKQMGEENVKEIAAGVEHAIAQAISKPMLWAKNSLKRLTFVGLTAVVLGFAFIGAGGYLATKVAFNIFPPSKDANEMQVALSFEPGTPIEDAQATVDKADEIIGKELGVNLEHASYFSQANQRSATLLITLTSYHERDIRSPEIVADLQEVFDSFEGASAKVAQLDAGPPATPFVVQIDATEREQAFGLAQDVATYLGGLELTRPSGEVAKVTSVSVADPNVISRTDGVEGLRVSAEFDGTDTSTLVLLAESAVEKEFPASRVASYGLSEDALQFDFGQESENQESFQTLIYAFPLVLLAIYILLATQFRSLLQPLLIFMAIPFSFFGISLSLYLTDNPFSFFAMLGFFALIGLSIKNTILLTDYANQSRRAGMRPVDAIVEALGERFRPLVATSLTAVVSLIPLSIISPFWQGLAVLIIFGLLSSTLMVILIFPYYYLGAEFLRIRSGRLVRRLRKQR